MDILESIYIAHRIYQVCNLSQLKLERTSWSLMRCRSLEVYSICVLLISICLLFHSLLVEEDYMEIYGLSKISQKFDFIQLVGIRVAHIFTILETMARQNEQQKFYEKVQEIDRVFKCSLNVSVDNRSLRRKILKIAAIIFTIIISSELFLLSIILLIGSEKDVIYWSFYLVPYIICSFRYFQIFTAILIIKQRLEILIAALEKVYLHEKSQKISPTIKLIQPRVAIFETTERMNRHLNMENSELRKLVIIRDLYSRLWEITGILNCCVGISVLINVANDFLSLTSNCYWLFLESKKTNFDFLETALGAIWSLSHLCNILVLAILCDRTAQSTAKVASLLHRIEIDIQNDKHNTVIERFFLQILHEKITFTAAGFFNIDYTLLYTIVAATTTYLVILIQFEMIEKNTNP